MSIIERIRRETAPMHQRLERAVPLMAPKPTVAVYRRYLSRLWGIYCPLESQLAARTDWCDAGLTYEDRRKTAQLRADLRALGLREADLEQLPRCAALPDTSSLARAGGCMYVLEGATLGGQVLLRHLRAHLPSLDETRGLSFLAGYGSATVARWQSFCDWLSRWSGVSAAEDSVIAAAIETFACFESWLLDRGVPNG